MDTAPTRPDCAAATPPKRRRRGRDFDGRTREARRLRAVLAEAAARTPLDPDSPVVAARLRAYANVVVAIEGISARQARGEPADAAELVALTNAHGRLMRELGFVTKRKS